ncbi:hypothetical protein [Paraburkholderia sp. J8-2]|uniref:hypothetical protein n=1 Tax=Paraburkholderia sp. J8-2 TaxID=2805440 RepID=UPI002AB7D4FB|nr:hypothetical protein [Paraburkholderia sp. J8-2]
MFDAIGDFGDRVTRRTNSLDEILQHPDIDFHRGLLVVALVQRRQRGPFTKDRTGAAGVKEMTGFAGVRIRRGAYREYRVIDGTSTQRCSSATPRLPSLESEVRHLWRAGERLGPHPGVCVGIDEFVRAKVGQLLLLKPSCGRYSRPLVDGECCRVAAYGDVGARVQSASSGRSSTLGLCHSNVSPAQRAVVQPGFQVIHASD